MASYPHPNRRLVEDFWHEKLNLARMKYLYTKVRYREAWVAAQKRPGGGYAADFVLLDRLMLRKLAATAEYAELLTIFTGLVVHGKVPEEIEIADVCKTANC